MWIWLAAFVLLALIIIAIIGGKKPKARGPEPNQLVFCKKQGKMVPASQCPCPNKQY